MEKNLVVRKEEKELTLSDLSLQIGRSVEETQKLLTRYELSGKMLLEAITLSTEFESKLHKACSLLKEHDGNTELVADIYEARDEMEGVSLLSISILLKKFGGEHVYIVIEAIEEAHQFSSNKFIISTVLDLIKITESNESIIWIDGCVEEYKAQNGWGGE